MSDHTIKVVGVTDHDDGSATIVVDLDTETAKLVIQIGLKKLFEDYVNEQEKTNE